MFCSLNQCHKTKTAHCWKGVFLVLFHYSNQLPRTIKTPGAYARYVSPLHFSHAWGHTLTSTHTPIKPTAHNMTFLIPFSRGLLTFMRFIIHLVQLIWCIEPGIMALKLSQSWTGAGYTLAKEVKAYMNILVKWAFVFCPMNRQRKTI